MADVEIITNIEGLDELEKTLTEGSRQAAMKFLRAAERKAARPIQRAARDNAPYLTGQLEGDIQISTKIIGDQMLVRVGPGKDSFYGLFSEIGTETEPAQHWLSASFEETKEESLTVLINELTKALEGMAQK